MYFFQFCMSTRVGGLIALSYHHLYSYFKTYPLCFGVDLGSGMMFIFQVYL